MQGSTGERLGAYSDLFSILGAGPLVIYQPEMDQTILLHTFLLRSIEFEL